MMQIKKGSTNVSVEIRILDDTDGKPEGAVNASTPGLALWYRRVGAVKVELTENDLGSLDAAHNDGGMYAIGDGYYRLDLPDAAFATAAAGVIWGGTATGMVVQGARAQLVDFNPEDSTRLGLTALPDANADAAGGVPISDTGGLDLDAVKERTDNLPDDPADSSDVHAHLTGVQSDIAALDAKRAVARAAEHTAAVFVSGSSMYAEAADDPDFDVGDDDFILSYWIKTVDNDFPVLYKTEGGSDPELLHYSSYVSAQGYAVGHAGDGTDETGPAHYATPVNDGLIHHVACTFDKSARAMVYVDGIPDRDQDDDCSDVGNLDNDHVLRLARYSTYYFDGKLLDVRIYRCGVGGLPTNIDDAIRALYRGGPGFHPTELSGEDLTAHFLPGDIGDFTDQSGNGNDLTGYNSPTFTGAKIRPVLAAADVNAEVDAALASYDGPTKAEVDSAIAALNDVSTADLLAQANAAIVFAHLDHLFKEPFDPTSKPGNPLGLWNKIIEDDSGVPRFTANVLENAPGGETSITLYKVLGDLVQDVDGKLYWTAWCEKNGTPFDSTNCRIQLYQVNGDGSSTAMEGQSQTVATDDPQYMFNGYLQPSLEAGTEYYLTIDIYCDGSDRGGRLAFKVPVRTTT